MTPCSYKVRPLIVKTLELFPKYYKPKQDLAIDEMMVGTRFFCNTSLKSQQNGGSQFSSILNLALITS